MANPTIFNAASQPLNVKTGTVPDVSGALRDWFQPLTFTLIAKSVVGFQEVETQTVVSFQGSIQPFTPRELLMKPEGERAWTWMTLHAFPVLKLEVDDIVIYNGVQTRVMSLQDWSLNGYLIYEICQDWQ